ncbi:pleiotropic drug resistance protein 3-like isoform X1 [Carex littledalei]|uniref:Pleiotropic drug resistance protein 3-like isoform X1 n=1 Tax=Carex littledalei TaxID=544730 RepID=A0A833RK20_9POAL|nr:pleiotropic drug resistance protein 3-like isoform X1 [Carex littledalei]
MERKKEEEMSDDDDIHSNTGSVNSIGRSRRWSLREAALSLSKSLSGGDEDERKRDEEEEELQLQWAAIERLPTYNRLRTSLFFQHQHVVEEGEKQGRVPVDVGRLGPIERHLFIESMIKHIEKDNMTLLQKQRRRIDRVNVKQPTIEVRYKNLCVEAECEVVQGKPLPTLLNSLMSTISVQTTIPV